ncbi:MAG: 50S ribosomal protein L23 [Chloroflexota bacterium]
MAVNVVTKQPQTKVTGTRRGRTTGRISGWRKAIVTLAPGQKIQFFEGV